MTLINELHELRAECRALLAKIPAGQLSNFEKDAIKTIMEMESRLYRLSEQIKKILPEAE